MASLGSFLLALLYYLLDACIAAFKADDVGGWVAQEPPDWSLQLTKARVARFCVTARGPAAP